MAAALPRAAAGALTLGVVLALSGCGGAEEPERVSPEKTGTSATELQAPVADVPAPGAPGSVDAPLAKDAVGGVAVARDPKLPAGFPVEQIPLADGMVTRGTAGKVGGQYAFTVFVTVRGSSASAALDAITRQLSGAGFTATRGLDTPAASAGQFSTARYQVGVNAVTDNREVNITYVVKQL